MLLNQIALFRYYEDWNQMLTWASGCNGRASDFQKCPLLSTPGADAETINAWHEPWGGWALLSVWCEPLHWLTWALNRSTTLMPLALWVPVASRTGAETPLAGQGAAASFTWAQVVLEFGGPRKFEGAASLLFLKQDVLSWCVSVKVQTKIDSENGSNCDSLSRNLTAAKYFFSSPAALLMWQTNSWQENGNKCSSNKSVTLFYCPE